MLTRRNKYKYHNIILFCPMETGAMSVMCILFVFQIYDTGYISLDATLLRQNAAVVTPSPLQTNFPYIAPNWIQDNCML